jgi:hypothetical protein
MSDYWSNQIKKDEMSSACSTNGQYEECLTNIWLENRRGDLDIGRRIRLKWALKKGHIRIWAGFIYLWIGSIGRLVNVVMNRWVP